MLNYERPTFKDLFKKETIVVVKREYRSLYRLNWKKFFRNLYNMLAFWKPRLNKFALSAPAIEVNHSENEIAVIRKDVIDEGLNGRNTMVDSK